MPVEWCVVVSTLRNACGCVQGEMFVDEMCMGVCSVRYVVGVGWEVCGCVQSEVCVCVGRVRGAWVCAG